VNETSDAELMARLATGDPDALASLYRMYGRLVAGLLRRYGSALATADIKDLTQDVFLTIHRKAKKYREQGKLRSWLCGIAIRTVKAHIRQQVRSGLRSRYAGEGSGVARPQSDLGQRAQARMDLDAALRRLPEEQREVLLLHTIEQLEGEEIAKMLKISPNTVWTRLHRARGRLRKIIHELDGTSGKDDG